MTSYSTVKSMIESRYLDLKGCGANKTGGGGFVAGNTCAKGGSSATTGPLTDDEKEIATAKLDKLAKLDEPNYEAVFGKTNNISSGDVFTASAPVQAAAGVSNKDSKKFGVEKEIELSTLTAGQVHIPREGLRAYIKEMPKDSARLPEVVKLKNDAKERTIIISGHTRLGAQVLAGRTHAKVIAYVLDRKTGDLVKE